MIFIDLDDTLIHVLDDTQGNALARLQRQSEVAARMSPAAARRAQNQLQLFQGAPRIQVGPVAYLVAVRPGAVAMLDALAAHPLAIFTWAQVDYAEAALAAVGLRNRFLRVFAKDAPPKTLVAQGQPFVLVDDLDYGTQGVQSKLRLLADDFGPENHVLATDLANVGAQAEAQLAEQTRKNPDSTGPAYGKARFRPPTIFPVARVIAVFRRLEDDLIKWNLRPDRMMFLWGKPSEFKETRAFAYTMKPRAMVYVVVAPKLEKASRGRIEGIMRHEMAHALQLEWPRAKLDQIIRAAGLISPPGMERHADVLAHALWGAPILYDSATVQDIDAGMTQRPFHLPDPPYEEPRKR